MRSFFKRLLEIIKPYWLHEILGFALVILYVLTVAAIPFVSKYLIDEILPSKSYGKLYYGILLFFIICVSQPVLGFFKNMIFSSISLKITRNLQKVMHRRLLMSHLSFFDRNQNGEIVSRIINDGQAASDFISNFFVVFIYNIVLIVLLIASMFVMAWDITLFILVAFLAYFIINWVISRKFSALAKRMRISYDNICNSVSHMATGIMTIKLYLLEKQYEDKFNNIVEDTYLLNRKFNFLSILLESSSNILVICSLCFIYGFGTVKIMNGYMTLGTVIAMGLYFQQLSQPIYELLNNNIDIRKNIPVFERLYEYLELKSETTSDYSLDNQRGLEIRNLYFSYKEDVLVLENISLTLGQTGLYAFVGSSGSGKSTLTKLLVGLYRPLSGQIFIGDTDIMEVGVNELRKIISFVPQETDLFSESIKENIKCGNSYISDDDITRICKKLNLHNRIMALSDGYESVVTERVNLSVGEKQRISIARALLKKSKIIILDEPTSALDPENEAIINDTINQASKQKIVIVITHRISSILEADKIFVFSNGKLVEEGNHSLLMTEETTYKKLYLMQ